LKRFVLDASVALAWFIDRSIAPYAMRVQRLLLGGDRAVVPPLWRLEVANGFVVAERRGILTPSDTAQTLQNFQIVLAEAIEESQHSLSAHRVIATAREFQLTESTSFPSRLLIGAWKRRQRGQVSTWYASYSYL
jgi:predicted nucleic acid-binding protein